jgi:hypothetical protein
MGNSNNVNINVNSNNTYNFIIKIILSAVAILAFLTWYSSKEENNSNIPPQQQEQPHAVKAGEGKG